MKDKSPEVYMFDSHLTQQLSAARGNTGVHVSSSSQRLSLLPYSHFACLVQALGKSVNGAMPNLLARNEAGTSTLGKQKPGQGWAALSKQCSNLFIIPVGEMLLS